MEIVKFAGSAKMGEDTGTEILDLSFKYAARSGRSMSLSVTGTDFHEVTITDVAPVEVLAIQSEFPIKVAIGSNSSMHFLTNGYCVLESKFGTYLGLANVTSCVNAVKIFVAGQG